MSLSQALSSTSLSSQFSRDCQTSRFFPHALSDFSSRFRLGLHHRRRSRLQDCQALQESWTVIPSPNSDFQKHYAAINSELQSLIKFSVYCLSLVMSEKFLRVPFVASSHFKNIYCCNPKTDLKIRQNKFGLLLCCYLRDPRIFREKY